MNFEVYKTLTPKEKLFADLLLDLLKACQPIEFPTIDYQGEEGSLTYEDPTPQTAPQPKIA